MPSNGCAPAPERADYGKRLLPVHLDILAKTNPNQLYGIVPTGKDYSSGQREITVADLSRAVDRASWWLEKKVGRKDGFPTVGYMGPNDPRYPILAIAAMKTRCKILLNSPRNSVEGSLHVFEATDCNILLKDQSFNVSDILEERRMAYTDAPDLDYFLDPAPVDRYAFNKTFEEAESDPCIIIHSSGSTGPPKPIVKTHGGLTAVDAFHVLPSREGMVPLMSTLELPAKLMLHMPLFHVAGLLGSLPYNLYFGVATVFLPPSLPPNTSAIHNVIDNVGVDCGFVAPSVLETMSDSKESLARLGKLKWIWYAGGPIAKSPGEKICKHTRLFNFLGTSESGPYPQHATANEEWQYLYFSPNLKGFDFRDRGDGLFEMVLVRHPSTDKFHSTWYTYPDLQEYPTHDLFSKHPTKPNHWLHNSRTDDVIVLSNGEKVVPLPQEQVLNEAYEVKRILIHGHGRFEIAALIELESDAEQFTRSEILEKLSPYIQRANEKAPGHGRLSKDRIVFTKPEKPMVLTPKMSVVRKATLAKYADEIEANYAGDADSEEAPGLPLMDGDEQAATEASLLELIKRLSNLKDLKVDQDLFLTGFDSLGVITLNRQIKAQLRSQNVAPATQDLVTPAFIYSNPTISKLANALRSLGDQPTDPESLSKARLDNIDNEVARYAETLPSKAKSTTSAKEGKLTVALTGSTGSLGTYLLEVLASSPIVKHVYCLNRSRDGHSKQQNASHSRGLSTKWGEKVSFLHVDLSSSDFSLSSEDHKALSQDVSFIIHNAWPVDFNLALPSFEPQIAGLRNLIEFSAGAEHRPPILFTSTIGEVGNWPKHYPDQNVPEALVEDARVVQETGYAESKYVSERLLVHAAEKGGVSASVCRVGQIAGPVEKGGVWNKQEWLPSLIASSAHLQLLPSHIGIQSNVDWVPVDIMANILLELMFHDYNTLHDSSSTKTMFHNLTNPQQGSWSTLLPTIQSYLPKGTKIVPWSEWLDALRRSSEQREVESNPAVKLLDFYENMDPDGESQSEEGEDSGRESGYYSGEENGAKQNRDGKTQDATTRPVEGSMIMDTRKSQEASETMAGLQAVGGDWMAKWMQQWGFKK